MLLVYRVALRLPCSTEATGDIPQLILVLLLPKEYHWNYMTYWLCCDFISAHSKAML